MRLPTLAPAILGLALVGCGLNPLSPVEMGWLDQAEAKWQERGFENYSYDVRAVNFWGWGSTEWRSVQFVNGVVTTSLVAEGTADSHPPWYPNVDEAFNLVRGFGDSENVQDIRVSYDRILGYPLSVRVQIDPAEGGTPVVWTLQFRNVTPIS